MRKQEKAFFIQQKLQELYPNPPIALEHSDAYTLLIAVLLSAQCTDNRVNLVTPQLFARASTPQEMVALPVSEIQTIIRSCGLAPAKARHIHRLSQQLIELHQSQVPASFEQLEALPGVGHKTASVVMAQAFGIPAFPVDTHIQRLAWRWGLASGSTVKETERSLKSLFPQENWNKLHLQIIYFGREYCPARGHAALQCPICSRCGRREVFTQ